MKIRNLLIVFAVLFFISCKKGVKDTAFEIYHLNPDRIYTADSDSINGRFYTSRNDFFTVKNYDVNNEQHKIKIDSFIVNYLKNDDFLATHNNASWGFTFFKYGDGINETTSHQYNTDFTIHNLFSYKKEIGNFHFNTRAGYASSNYNITIEKFNKKKRKLILDYFNSNIELNKKIESEQNSRGSFSPHTHKQDTIKVFAKLINKGLDDKIKIAQYQFLAPVTSLVVLEGDTINVGYSAVYKAKILPEKAILTLVKDNGVEVVKNHFVFPGYNPKKGIKRINKEELKTLNTLLEK